MWRLDNQVEECQCRDFVEDSCTVHTLDHMFGDNFDQYAPISSSRDILNRVAVLALLLFTLMGYLCIGSVCFSALEYDTEQQRWQEGKDKLEGFVREILEPSKNFSEYSEDLTVLVRALADEANPYIYEGRKEAWSFTGGLYVSVSTVTTIGYGNIYPVTTGGQVFLLVFALIGIPLCFLFIAYLGALLAQSVEYVFNFPLRDRNKKRIMIAVLLSSAGLVLIELIIFSLWIKYGLDKEMTYWDSFYFAFVSFTTIGFGNHGFYNGDNANIAKVCFTLLIVILCLAPLALYINLIVRDVITAASPILEKIGVTEHADPEQEMISQTKEFKGEPYGAAEERAS